MFLEFNGFFNDLLDYKLPYIKHAVVSAFVRNPCVKWFFMTLDDNSNDFFSIAPKSFPGLQYNNYSRSQLSAYASWMILIAGAFAGQSFFIKKGEINESCDNVAKKDDSSTFSSLLTLVTIVCSLKFLSHSVREMVSDILKIQDNSHQFFEKHQNSAIECVIQDLKEKTDSSFLNRAIFVFSLYEFLVSSDFLKDKQEFEAQELLNYIENNDDQYKILIINACDMTNKFMNSHPVYFENKARITLPEPSSFFEKVWSKAPQISLIQTC